MKVQATKKEELVNVFHAHKTLLKYEDVANILQVSMMTMCRMVAENRVPFLRIGRTIRFEPHTLARWIELGCPSAISVGVQRVVDCMIENDADLQQER